MFRRNMLRFNRRRPGENRLNCGFNGIKEAIHVGFLPLYFSQSPKHQDPKEEKDKEKVMQPLRFKKDCDQLAMILKDAKGKDLFPSLQYKYRPLEPVNVDADAQGEGEWHSIKVRMTASANEQVTVKWPKEGTNEWLYAVFPTPGYEYKEIEVVFDADATTALTWEEHARPTQSLGTKPPGTTTEYPPFSRTRAERNHPYPVGSHGVLKVRNNETQELTTITGTFTEKGIRTDDREWELPIHDFQIISATSTNEPSSIDQTTQQDGMPSTTSFPNIWRYLTEQTDTRPWKQKVLDIKTTLFREFDIPPQQTHRRNIMATRVIEWLLSAEHLRSHNATSQQVQCGRGLFEDLKVATEAYKNDIPEYKLRLVIKAHNTTTDNIDTAVARMTSAKNYRRSSSNKPRFRPPSVQRRDPQPSQTVSQPGRRTEQRDRTDTNRRHS